MNLLFDALKHTQNKPNSGKNGASQQTTETINTVPTSGSHPGTNALPYIVTGLTLLTGSILWFYYQQTQDNHVAPQYPTQITGALPAVTPLAVSHTVAVSSVAETITAPPATASGADSPTYKDATWVHPVNSKKPAKHEFQRQSAKPDIQASSNQDPLKSAYLALSGGHLDQAEQQYLSALKQRPHEKDALLGLAVIAHRKQQNERAADLYRQVLREDLGNAAAAAGLISLSVHADPLAAESQLRELIDVKPTAPEFHYALGCVLARQQRWGEAQQAFFRAHSLEPGKALYAYNLAVSLDHLHQPAAALPYYEQSSRLSNDTMLDMAVIRQRIQELGISR